MTAERDRRSSKSRVGLRERRIKEDKDDKTEDDDNRRLR
mgnify:CR=1 FL=1